MVELHIDPYHRIFMEQWPLLVCLHGKSPMMIENPQNHYDLRSHLQISFAFKLNRNSRLHNIYGIKSNRKAAVLLRGMPK